MLWRPCNLLLELGPRAITPCFLQSWFWKRGQTSDRSYRQICHATVNEHPSEHQPTPEPPTPAPLPRESYTRWRATRRTWVAYGGRGGGEGWGCCVGCWWLVRVSVCQERCVSLLLFFRRVCSILGVRFWHFSKTVSVCGSVWTLNLQAQLKLHLRRSFFVDVTMRARPLALN